MQPKYKQNQFKILDFLWSWYKALAWFMWNEGGSEADWATVAMALIDAFVLQLLVGSTEEYSDSQGLMRVKRLHVVLWQNLTLWWGDWFSPYSTGSHLWFWDEMQHGCKWFHYRVWTLAFGALDTAAGINEGVKLSQCASLTGCAVGLYIYICPRWCEQHEHTLEGNGGKRQL